MKTTSIFSLFILFACAIPSPVFGSPTPTCDVGQACVELRDDAQVLDFQPTANATIKYIKENAAAVNKIPICFYSGSTTIGGQDIQTYIKINNGQLNATIKPAQTHILADIIKDAKQNSDGWKDPEWNAVSGTLAEYASGSIFIFLGEKIRSKSVFLETELPTLIRNKGVTVNQTYYLNPDGTISK